MLEERLVEIIENRANDVAQKWYYDMQVSQYLPTIQHVSEEEGMRLGLFVYKNLGEWLLPSGSKDIKETYTGFGESLFHKGFHMEEVVMMLILLKRYLWLALLEMGLMTTDLNIYQALELNNKVVLYFDRAIYFALIGYKEARAASERAVKA